MVILRMVIELPECSQAILLALFESWWLIAVFLHHEGCEFSACNDVEVRSTVSEAIPTCSRARAMWKGTDGR